MHSVAIATAGLMAHGLLLFGSADCCRSGFRINYQAFSGTSCGNLAPQNHPKTKRTEIDGHSGKNGAVPEFGVQCRTEQSAGEASWFRNTPRMALLIASHHIHPKKKPNFRHSQTTRP
jgi:hypothetical protein